MSYNKNVDKFDDLLGVFAKAHPDIESLSDSFFHWMRVRTDFFHVKESSDEEKGFYKGEAQKKLLKVFNKHLEEYRIENSNAKAQLNINAAKKINDNLNSKTKSSSATNSTQTTSKQTPEKQNAQKKTHEQKSNVVWISRINKAFYRNEEKVKLMIDQMLGEKVNCVEIMWPDDDQDPSVAIELENFEAAHKLTKDIKDKKFTNQYFWEREDNNNTDDLEDEVEAELITYTNAKETNVENETQSNSENANHPDFPKETAQKDNHIEPWNGGKTEDYIWSQSIDEISVELFNLNSPIIKKDIEINGDSKHLSISHKGKIIKSGELFEEILWTDLIWSIEDGSKIMITLFKKEELWWSSLFLLDEKIDTTKIEAVKNLSDYDQATQAEVMKMMQQHSLKESNPNSNIILDENLLSQAMKSES